MLYKYIKYTYDKLATVTLHSLAIYNTKYPLFYYYVDHVISSSLYSTYRLSRFGSVYKFLMSIKYDISSFSMQYIKSIRQSIVKKSHLLNYVILHCIEHERDDVGIV